MGKTWSPKFKSVVWEVAEGLSSDARPYREFDVPRLTFYAWEKAFRKEGAAGRIPKKPIAKSHPRQLSPDVVEKII